MTQHDPELAAAARQTKRGELTFDVSELLVSRTDRNGVIMAGNEAFRRLTGYDWSELLQKPHNVVRHPDMPRGMFFLKWKKLKAGEPVVLYVKNRAKDGRHYWVLAVVWPSESGFFSMRISPSLELRDKIARIYAKLHDEEAQGLSPEKSHLRLIEEIGQLGFASYEEYQANALLQGITARAQKLGHSLDSAQQRFAKMQDAINAIGRETEQMTESFKGIRTVPMNMRILASRLENAGGPISAISVNYGSMLDEMANWVRAFVQGDDSAFVRMRTAILNGMFLTCLATLQAELVADFKDDSAATDGALDMVKERAILAEQTAEYRERAREALKVVEVEATRLSRGVLDMKRYVTGLSSTRMMCKIESAALSGSGDSLAGIVEQLDDCQDEIEARLAKIVELNTVIQSNTSMLRALM